jgi:hypothetical protein
MAFIEIFKTGTHTDSAGREREWTERDLDKIVEKYNSQKEHEAPIVVGHPKDNSPAFGWVESLKREGNKLLAKVKDVAENFKEWVNQGLYKKRSISLYPDMLLRHVGFLGAVPPAVKGLADFKFQDDNKEILEYFEENKTFKEEDMTKEEIEAMREKLAQVEAEKKKLADEFAELQKKKAEDDIENFIEGKIKDGKILPAWKESGLKEFMIALSEDEEVIEFAEGKKENKLAWFKEFLEELSKHELFKDFGEKGGKEKQEFEEFDKLAEEIAGKGE